MIDPSALIIDRIKKHLGLNDCGVTLMPWKWQKGFESDSENLFEYCPIKDCVAVSIYSEYSEDRFSEDLGDVIIRRVEAKFDLPSAIEVAKILQGFGFCGAVSLSTTKKTYNLWRRHPIHLLPDGTFDRNRYSSSKADEGESEFYRRSDYVCFQGIWMHEDEL